MWITKDSAKSLSTTMKVMGVSQEDIAWIPELREQFFRLRNEMNELATPVDADNQLQWIREIGYDVQSLQVKLKMLERMDRLLPDQVSSAIYQGISAIYPVAE
ncbi:MAG: hypothetical protein ACLU45_01785 [Dialister invisus]|uniref:hypothetical protein n=1 Tax=Dialister invisus TaxID=218538 RepID=UPI00399BFDEB